MDRNEMVELRKALIERLERMRRVGDWGAGAADIRQNAEDQLKIVEHLLERLR